VDTASATFNNSSLDGMEFFWDFGDSNTSMEESPTHTYGATGTYEVTFLVENGPCQDSSTLEVVIDVLSGLVDLEELGVRIFPNPTSGQLTLTGPARIFGIYDLTGRQVMGGGERSHDLSALPAGVYMVGVLAGGRTHWVRIVRR
jgi:PKD repeat protein